MHESVAEVVAYAAPLLCGCLFGITVFAILDRITRS